MRLKVVLMMTSVLDYRKIQYVRYQRYEDMYMCIYDVMYK